MGQKLPSFSWTRKYFEWTQGFTGSFAPFSNKFWISFERARTWCGSHTTVGWTCVLTGGVWRNWKQYSFSSVSRSHLLSVVLLQWCNWNVAVWQLVQCSSRYTQYTGNETQLLLPWCAQGPPEQLERRSDQAIMAIGGGCCDIHQGAWTEPATPTA